MFTIMMCLGILCGDQMSKGILLRNYANVCTNVMTYNSVLYDYNNSCNDHTLGNNNIETTHLYERSLCTWQHEGCDEDQI